MKKAAALWLVLLISVFTPVAATLLYLMRPDLGTAAAGELVEPVAIPARLLAAASNGSAARVWRLVAVGTAPCGPECASRLCVLRQARLAHLPERFRIARLWLISGGIASGGPVYSDPACAAHDSAAQNIAAVEVLGGVAIVPASPAELAFLPKPSGELAAEDYVYVVDPQGSLILRYAGPEASRQLASDLGRLLRLSRIAQ